VEDELERRSEGRRGRRLGEGWRRGWRDPRSEGWRGRRGARVAGSERGGTVRGVARVASRRGHRGRRQRVGGGGMGGRSRRDGGKQKDKGGCDG
jgi:hypothetical protein